MRIANIRLGFACNSSSSHSIVLLRDPVDDEKLEGENSFGWQTFTAASEGAKRRYAATVIYENVSALVSEPIAALVAESWAGAKLRRDSESGRVSDYVDHDSLPVLPMDWSGKGLDEAFAKEWTTYLLRKGVTILGGNDNGGDDAVHRLAGVGEPAGGALLKDDSSKSIVARKDPLTGFWTTFSRENGTRIRFSFDRDATPPTKAHAPELVDLKITDFCPIGCKYCYQDSTAKGDHADKELVNVLLMELADLRVFEVAIGGGEPTFHPHLIEILKTARFYGIVPNLTTKRIDWLRDAQFRDAVFDHVGAVAFSVESAEAAEGVIAHLRTNGLFKDRHRVALQHVVGSADGYGLEDIIEAAAHHGIRLNLLGYKTTGRGAAFKPRIVDWIKTIKGAVAKGFWPNIAIDTVLAAEAGSDLLSELNVHDVLYDTKDGRFSMYIDAVRKRIGPSSYCAEEEYLPLKSPRNDQRDMDWFVEAFARW